MKHQSKKSQAIPGVSGLRTRLRAAAVCGLAIFSAASAHAQSHATPIPFREFVRQLKAASAADYLGQRGAEVENAAAFEEMRGYLQSYYAGIQPARSFVRGGQVVDCVPLHQQPALRPEHTTTIATPPPGDDGNDGRAPGISAAKLNATGSVDRCSPGTIPLRRLTLEEMTKSRTLDQFFRKAPDSATHEYAVAMENVDNWGGNAALNLWKTSVNSSRGEVFSLAQHWYVGGSGSALQTAETGWINYPAKFGSDPVLFIYWTADAYNSTGCYNLECTAFVQTNSDWCLGCKFDNYSKTQGKQYEIELGYYLYQGNWWLKVSRHFWNTHSTEWLGYYPATIYNGGQMSQNAQEIEYGGEVAATGTSWPCMGSCHFADDGYQSAAYVRRIGYRGDTSNRLYDPSLSTLESNTQCYTITALTDNGDKWKTYFYFGGPGGNDC